MFRVRSDRERTRYEASAGIRGRMDQVDAAIDHVIVNRAHNSGFVQPETEVVICLLCLDLFQ